MKKAIFQRALFFSWYCSVRDCDFCFMSLQKKAKQNKALRNESSILAEALISRSFGWKVEFLSGGYSSYPLSRIIDLAKNVGCITGEKPWLNVGTLPKIALIKLKPYITGVAGTLETPNMNIRAKAVPSKPLKAIEKMYESATELGLKKATTIIIGLGETIKDFTYLKEFTEKHKLDKITFYALNPHNGTPYNASPTLDYYIEWIKLAKINFPNTEIVAGVWSDKLEYLPELLKYADYYTKLPALRMLYSKKGIELENSLVQNNYEVSSRFTEMIEEPRLDLVPKQLRDEVKKKLNIYFKRRRTFKK